MAKSRKNLTRGAEFTRTYDLHGLGGDVSKLVNMYVDYEGGGRDIETLPGFRRIHTLDAKISALYRQKLDTGMDYLVIQSGEDLYRVKAGSDSTPEKIATLSSEKSTAFTLGESLYILDGQKILELSPDGKVHNISDEPYIPTTYKNGSPYEERNLLTKWSYQEYEVEIAEEFTYGSPTLIYSISDYKKQECAVSGVDKASEEGLYIPSYKYIGGVRYAVTEILPHALEDSNITELTVAEGVTKIGESAVRDCKKLRRVILPSSISEIHSYAFSGDSVLEYVRLGIGLSKIGTGVFGLCPALKGVAYEGNAAQLAEVEGVGALDAKEKTYNVTHNAVTIAFSTHGSGFCPHLVYIDGISKDFSNAGANQVIIELDYKSEIEGKLVKIYGFEAEENGMRCELGADFVSLYGDRGEPEEAIYGCTLSTVFDGKVFLSGNPRFPGIVFYSTDNLDGKNTPKYFGSYDFFTTGSSYTVSSLLALSDSLIVTKSGEVGEGSILTYSRGKMLSSPRSTRYIRGEAYTVTGGISHAVVYSGVPLFLLGDRLYKLAGSPKTLTPATKELGFDYILHERIFSLEWQGYLFLSVGERIVLVDNRAEGDYRIYPLSDIGSYKSSTRVYVYAEYAPRGFILSDTSGEVDYDIVMSESLTTGKLVYYVMKGTQRVVVTPTEEMRGGSFYPAQCAVSIGRLLYFGTDSGDICIFNNDKRGVPPNRIKNSSGFDKAEYSRTMGDKIHPDFYDFMGHKILYSLSTAGDACDEPSIYKITSPEGVLLELSSESCVSLSYAKVCDELPREERTVLHGPFDFSNLDFAALTFLPNSRATLSLPEESEVWIRHGVKIKGTAFRAPVKIISLSLGYKAGKKIKN